MTNEELMKKLDGTLKLITNHEGAYIRNSNLRDGETYMVGISLEDTKIIQAALKAARDMIPRGIESGELLPCPFCGGESGIEDQDKPPYADLGCKDNECIGHAIGCIDTHESEYGLEEIKRYNTRTTDKILEKLREDLE